MHDHTQRVWTIGYQGQEIDPFLATLQGAGVTLLVDVRRRAQSRKPGFSKSALRSALEGVGIAYAHLRDLGMFDDLIPQRSLEDNTGILTEYRRRLEADPEALTELRGLVADHRACLLCFEADHRLCHRSVLADLLGIDTVHL